jgi:hypothetical protein
MNSAQRVDARTRMFSRVLGPYLVIVTITALARASLMSALIHDFGSNSVWPWVSGAFVLLGGLVIVAMHQNWRGATAIIVSLVGWLTVLKGFALLAFPGPYLSAGAAAVDSGSWWWRVVMMLSALAGLYLTYVGWAPVRRTSTGTTATPTADLPRAA